MNEFRGISYLSKDPKGRFTMPKRYRETLKGYCKNWIIITAYLDGCLLIYPYNEWSAVQKSVEQGEQGFPSSDGAIRMAKRIIVGCATECELDSGARFLLPLPLIDYCGDIKTGVLIGQGNYFELWGQERWKESIKPYQDGTARIPDFTQTTAPRSAPPQPENSLPASIPHESPAGT